MSPLRSSPALQLGQQSLGVVAPVQKYEVVLADPPWKYDFTPAKNRSPDQHYPSLTDDQIAGLPVDSIVTSNSLLFLWVTNPRLEAGLHVLRSWGFAYVTNAVWDKEIMGTGFHFRGQHELLLVGKRGQPGRPPPSLSTPSVIRARRGRHSQKPVQVYEYVEAAYPHASKIELFARDRRKGWAAWGNEVDSDLDWSDPAAAERPQLALDL